MMFGRRFALALGILIIGGGAAIAASLSAPPTAPVSHWQELRSPKSIWPQAGAIYYSFNLSGGSHVHLVVVDTKPGSWSIRPAIAPSAVAQTSTQANPGGASAAINGGYFNLSGDVGGSTSYVTIDGITVADPHNNKTLTENPKLQPYLQKIFDRTELRVIEDQKGKTSLQIARHSDQTPGGFKIVHALQAGPRLLPAVTAEEEAFIRVDSNGTSVDSIGVRKPAARTAFGITPDGYAVLVTVAGKGQDAESSGVTLDELASIMKNLGCSEAINMDGGASSTMYVRLSAPGIATADMRQPPGSVVCGKNPETYVKSVLLLMPRTSGAASRHMR